MKYTNREAAERIVVAITTALMLLPDKDDWKKLVDFAEFQINRQTEGIVREKMKPWMIWIDGFLSFFNNNERRIS